MMMMLRRQCNGISLMRRLNHQRLNHSTKVSTSTMRDLARALNENVDLTLQLVDNLDHGSKLRIANAIMDQESKAGRTYSDYLAAKHRRAIMVREISLSVGEDVTKLVDDNGDGKVSSDELDKWLQNVVKVEKSSKATPTAPTRKQYIQFALLAGVPFIGFGFVDNFIMLVAGDMIDISLGRAFGISTLAAAGLGNLVSDIAGLGVGGYIEAFGKNIGLKDPKLTLKQLAEPKVRIVQFLATSTGISIGCLLGMVPLLFMDTAESLEISELISMLDPTGTGIVDLNTAKMMMLDSKCLLTSANVDLLVTELQEYFPKLEPVPVSEFESFLQHMKTSERLQETPSTEIKFAVNLMRVIL